MITLERTNTDELKNSIKQLVNEIYDRMDNADEIAENLHEPIADYVFTSFDTRLIKSYFDFYLKAKAYKKSLNELVEY